MPGRKPKNTWVFVASGLVALVIVGGIVSLDALVMPINGLIRGAALLGYLSVFLTSLASIYMRELTRYFGRPFVQVHHIVSVTALVALATHATSVAFRAGTPAVFLPVFSSVYAFFSLGGRAAFWLLGIASLAAVYRASLGQNWRLIHWLNYIAFFLGTVHALLIGPNFVHVGLRVVAILMAIGLVAVFAWKRWTVYRRQQRRATSRS